MRNAHERATRLVTASKGASKSELDIILQPGAACYRLRSSWYCVLILEGSRETSEAQAGGQPTKVHGQAAARRID
eukprot:scaffold25220_cov52-Phaeocystis_antarctica.AAC.2